MQMSENVLETSVAFPNASTWPCSSPQEPAGKGLILIGVGTWVTGRTKEQFVLCVHECAAMCTSAPVPVLQACFKWQLCEFKHCLWKKQVWSQDKSVGVNFKVLPWSLMAQLQAQAGCSRLSKTRNSRRQMPEQINQLSKQTACEQEGNDGRWGSEEESKDRRMGEKRAQQTSGLKRQKAPAAAKYSRRPPTAAAHRSQVNLRQWNQPDPNWKAQGTHRHRCFSYHASMQQTI